MIVFVPEGGSHAKVMLSDVIPNDLKFSGSSGTTAKYKMSQNL